jgi:dipeptidyl aminopeptidase/acylaminoacyl peptidase
MRLKRSMVMARVGFCLIALGLAAHCGQSQGLVSSDVSRMGSVGEVALSPDGQHIAYTITMRDRPGHPYSQLWVMGLATQKSVRVGGEKDSGGSPTWSKDGKWVAFNGHQGEKEGLFIARPDGTSTTFLAATDGTNSPLPGTGNDKTWSPDSKMIAFVSATPGEGATDSGADPIVITRYLYKPDAGEGMTRFNDNKRLHIFLVDLATKQVKQLTNGNYDEHSIDWSPEGSKLVFASNRDPNQDEFFHYDLFTLSLTDNSLHRLTAGEYTEYDPLWSPDGKLLAYRGTKRGLTDRETTMEDTHVWVMNADGSNRREIGAVLDSRQSAPQWSPDGAALYFRIQERGSFPLVRLPIQGGPAEFILRDPGFVGAWSAGKNGVLAYSYSSPKDTAQLFYRSGPSAASKKLTDLNSELFSGKQLADVESFTFVSNDNRFEVEAFLTKPLGMTASSKHPLIVNIHGGPHSQNGPAFNFKNQVYAAHGYAVLNVNYRGSTGYGQKFTDAVFGDQDGNEAQDILYGVSAAVHRYLWIDRERLGIEGVSYGGQLTDWLITQTNEFKAAIPTAGIANLISYNYMTYYNQYEEMEFGEFLHQGNLMDVAWERSALKHIAGAHTPTLIVHGENDNDVPIAEAEQLFVALKDVGTEVVFLRYPREGHGLSETKHVIDWIDRSSSWYEKHFPKAGAEGVTNVQP